MQKTELPIFSVSEYVEYLNALVSLEPVLVEGEVSNFREIPGRNFCYFDIKDENAVARCFQGFWKSKKIELENGAKIQVFGVPTMQKNGTLVIDVLEILLQGKGALMQVYNKLKMKLQTEGLFGLEYKKQIPKFPEKIGLVAGKNSSAYHDVVTEISERWGGSDIFFAGCKVQGVGAKSQVVEAIRYFNQRFPVDTLIIARGGGSAEDLQAFDSEEVVREIFASKIPVISAIGHEDHWTLSDFVSDVRAKTPTKAGQLAVPDGSELKSGLDVARGEFGLKLKNRLDGFGFSLDSLRNDLGNLVISKLEGCIEGLDTKKEEISISVDDLLESKLSDLQQIARSFSFVDSKRVLRRGYCMLEKQGRRIKSVHQLKKGEDIRGKLHDGEFMGKIEDVMGKLT